MCSSIASVSAKMPSIILPELSRWYLKLLVIFAYTHVAPVVGQTILSFCDGDDAFVINEGECKGGINFGNRKPSCVCVTGVYRSWTEKCELFDGFIHNFCFSITDGSYDIKTVKLLSGIRNVYEDTAVVFGTQTSDDQNWSAFTVGMEGWTKSDNFYSLNGVPSILFLGNDRFICVQPLSKVNQQVCRFFYYENKSVWLRDEENIKIKVMPSCDPNTVTELQGYTSAQLKEHACYDIMGKNVSDCHLSCDTGKQARVPGSSLNSVVRTKKQANDSAPETTTNNSKTDGSIPEISTEVEVTPQTSNANFDFHRKLNKYIRLRQVNILKQPDISMSAPTRTFALLQIAKRVVTTAISTSFVSNLFLENALELFVLLHKGRNFRYAEDIDSRDFKLIEEILLKCRVGLLETPLELQGNRFVPGCEKDGLVDSACFIADGDVGICEKTTGGKYHETGKYHYVIDAVWAIIDMTHVLCLRYFLASYRMFHVWQQASENLFTREIRQLWYSPEVDLRVYDAILSCKATVNMINLDRAVEGAYKQSTLPRLLRPAKQKLNYRRKRDASSISSVAKSVDVYCVSNEDEFQNHCQEK